MPARKPERIMMISLHGYVAVDTELGRPDTGGQVVYVLKMAESLARLGYQVDVFTRQFDDQPMIEQISERARIVRIPAGGGDLIRKEWLSEAVPEWVANAEAWIHDHDLTYTSIGSHYWDAGLAGDKLARLLGVPHVHTPHSLGAWKRASLDGDSAALDRQYNFRERVQSERSIYQRAEMVVATSPQQADLLVGVDYGVPREKVAMLPPGYDDTRFFPVANATRQAIRRDLAVDDNMILAIGRIAANKGYDLLIRALPTVVERVPDAHLLLAIGATVPTPGEAQQVEEFKALAGQLGVGEQVRFRDHVPDDALADTYRAADVFALSSRYEPFGMTAVEAMACGTPTVVTTEGGLWQMLSWGADAIYADPLDPASFGIAIATILRYPDVAERLAEGGAARARATFTWNGIAQQLADVLHQVGAERPGVDATPRPDRVPAATGPGRTRKEDRSWVAAASS
jgi:mannosylfructose-phosphate synthase